MECDYVFKIQIVGDASVGKTSLINAYVDGVVIKKFSLLCLIFCIQ